MKNLLYKISANTPKEEISGLDLGEHGENAYNTGVFSATTNIFGNSEDYSLTLFPSVKSSQN